MAAIAVGNIVLWVVARPDGVPAGRFVGELCGAEAVLLFSSALVLATLHSPIERAFGGLDRVALWHRRGAEAGVLLLIPHVALVGSAPDPYATSFGHGLGDVALAGLVILALWAVAPSLQAARWPGIIRRMARSTCERWLTAHRLTGLFVLVGVIQGAIVDPVLHRSTLLLAVFLTVGGLGVIAYVYRELFARYFVPIYDNSVAGVRRLNETMLAVDLKPAREALSFSPGQFVFLAVGGPGGWERHPFSVSSSPDDPRVEFTIKAAGDYTRDLYDKLKPGIPAKRAGPFGGFGYRPGGHQQIWIAGGIGITRFISWLRSLGADFDRDVDFYYAVARERNAAYLDAIQNAAEQHPSLRVHMVCADTDDRLTADEVMHGVPPGTRPWVYMCGPPPMMKALSHGLHKRGLPDSRIRWEQFGGR